MGTLRGVINVVGGLLVAGGITYALYGFATAEGRVRELCGQIKPGMSIHAVNTFGAEHGLAPPLSYKPGLHFMVESKTFGRYGCRVRTEAGVVKDVEYTFSS